MPFDSPMTALKALLRRDYLVLTNTQAVDNPGGTKAVGQFQFSPEFYGADATFQLQAVMWTSKGSITGSVQLYNLTDGEAVTNGLLQTSSTSPGQVTGAAMTVGAAAGNLKDTTKTYEIRISVSGSDASDILSVGSVRLRVL